MALDYKAIMKQVQDAQNQANEANLARYQELIAGITQLTSDVVGAGGTYDQAAALIDTIGASARTQIAEAATRAKASSEQDLVSRGLGNTTIREAAKRGIASDTAKAVTAQAESEAAQKANLLTSKAGAQIGLGGMLGQAIEGRYDTGPDLGQFAALLESASAAPSTDKKTVTIGSGLPGPGFVTRKQAESAAAGAATSAAGGGGGGGGGGLSPSSGGSSGSTGVRTFAGFPAYQPAAGGGGGGERPATGTRPPVVQGSAAEANPLANTPGAGLASGEGFIQWDDNTLQGISGATEGNQGTTITTTQTGSQNRQDLAVALEAAGADAGVWKAGDYAEYKKQTGRNAVSPSYFNMFFVGQPKAFRNG